MNTKLGDADAAGQDPSPPTRRVIAVVELLAQRKETPLALAEICRELGISRSTGHAILHTLLISNWVQRDPLSGRFSLGKKFPRISAATNPPLLSDSLHELCVAIGMPVCISEVTGGSITVLDATAPGHEPPPIPAGLRLPFVAPFGREFVAWAPSAAREKWLTAAGAVNDVYRARMPKVLDEIRDRGYGIERLSDPLLRVYTALLALDNGDVPDPVSLRLAGAVADLTIVDFLGNELPEVHAYPLATISAPIFDRRGAVVLSVSAQPYRHLTHDEVCDTGAQVVDFASAATSLMSTNAHSTHSRHTSSSQ
jgi:DNA-binding IclR family transcriptional regulator